MARSGAGRGGNGRSGDGPGGPSELGSRVPPHDLDVERAVLSALLRDNNALRTVVGEVAPADFYHPAHQQLFQSMLALDDAREPVDLHTLANHLKERKLLDAVGGPVALAELWDYEVTAANVVQHARIVRDKAVRRQLIGIATEIAEMGYEQVEGAGELLDRAESRVFEISRSHSRATLESIGKGMDAAVDYLSALMERRGDLTGVPTGFKDLDQLTGGLQPGELIVIAARPSMGKTALALNIARNAAVDHGKKVAIFSLEMTKRALVLRLISSESRVDLSSFRRGFGSNDDFVRLTQAAGTLADAGIWIDDSGQINILEIKAKSRRLHADSGLDLVMLDYLQMAHGSAPAARKDLEIAEISHGLKALAKELQIPVVALSQLNRGPEQRDPDKRRPNMGDLRESGAIEQDADVIAFIYRDWVYNQTPENQGKAELIIQKQRNGPTGTLHLQFEDRHSQFRDLASPALGAGVAPSPALPSLPDEVPDPDDEVPF